MKRYFRELSGHILAKPTLFTVLAISTLLTVAGPFGTYTGLSLGERTIYWFSVVTLSVAVAFVVKTFVERKFSELNFWQSGAAVSTGFTILYTPML